MKIKIYLTLFVSLWCTAGILVAQNKFFTDDAPDKEQTVLDLPDCSENTFWTISNNGVQEWKLENGAAIGGDYIIEGAQPVNSIGWCEYNGQQVLMGTKWDESGTMYYDANGGQWLDAEAIMEPLKNCGCYGSHQYYTSTADGLDQTELYYFDGAGFNLIGETAANKKYILFDVPVDRDGNAWLAIGESSASPEVMNVYQPDGTIEATYLFSASTIHAYGAMALGETVYLGIGGSGNPANSLVPLVADDTTGEVTFGTPIPFDNMDFLDLAGCAPANMTSLNELSGTLDFELFPNPASYELFLHLGADHPGTVNVRLLDQLGSNLQHWKLTGSQHHLALPDQLAAGIYFVEVQSEKGTVRRSLVINQ